MPAHQTFPKPRPRFLETDDQRRALERDRREVYRLVDIRDQWTCRACSRRVRSTLAAVADRLEHHHLVFRSRGGRDETSNVVTLCLLDHSEAQRHELTITGNPDSTLTFERAGRIWHG
jgi:5-methylcytosine-specific restriction endonuclease McrA